MAYQTLTFRKDDHIAVITLAGVEKDMATLQRLSDELADLYPFKMRDIIDTVRNIE